MGGLAQTFQFVLGNLVLRLVLVDIDQNGGLFGGVGKVVFGQANLQANDADSEVELKAIKAKPAFLGEQIVSGAEAKVF